MFSDAEKEALKQTFRWVVPAADPAAVMFFERFFELAPEYRQLLPEDLTEPKQVFIKLLACFVKGIAWSDTEWKADIPPEDDVMLVTLGLGRYWSEHHKPATDLHVKVGQALLSTLKDGLGPSFSLDAERAWGRAHALLSQTFQMGAQAIDRELGQTALVRALDLGERALAEHRAQIALETSTQAYGEGGL